jgi:hypothetical protein
MMVQQQWQRLQLQAAAALLLVAAPQWPTAAAAMLRVHPVNILQQLWPQE